MLFAAMDWNAQQQAQLLQNQRHHQQQLYGSLLAAAAAAAAATVSQRAMVVQRPGNQFASAAAKPVDPSLKKTSVIWSPAADIENHNNNDDDDKTAGDDEKSRVWKFDTDRAKIRYSLYT